MVWIFEHLLTKIYKQEIYKTRNEQLCVTTKISIQMMYEFLCSFLHVLVICTQVRSQLNVVYLWRKKSISTIIYIYHRYFCIKMDSINQHFIFKNPFRIKSVFYFGNLLKLLNMLIKHVCITV